MTQTPQHLSPKQERDREIAAVRRSAMRHLDALPDIRICPTVGCGATLEVHGEGRHPDPYLHCATCGWTGDVFQHTMLAQSLRWPDAVNWVETYMHDSRPRLAAAPADGGKPFRWTNPDGTIGYDLPELTRRVLNAWETSMDLDPAQGDDVPAPTEITAWMLTDDEWKSICEILELLPTVYAERDRLRANMPAYILAELNS